MPPSPALGRRLADVAVPGATLVHNAGVWPHRREWTADGLETAFAVNHLAPQALQQPLLRAGRLDRVLAVGAGLMVKGRFDAERTMKRSPGPPPRTTRPRAGRAHRHRAPAGGGRTPLG